MKTLLKSVLFLGLALQLRAQNTELNLKYSEANKSIKLDQSITVFNSLCVLLSPQFDGLFNKDFKNVMGINRLENFYDDFDLGFNLGFACFIKENFKLETRYNFGVLKFDNSTKTLADAYSLKLVFNYVF